MPGCLIDEIGLVGLMLSEPVGDSGESGPDVAGIDVDDRVGLDLFAKRRHRDGQVEQFLAKALDGYRVVRFAQGEFGEEIDGVLMGVELDVQRRSKGLEGGRDSVQPCPVPPRRRCGERVFEHQ